MISSDVLVDCLLWGRLCLYVTCLTTKPLSTPEYLGVQI